MGIKRLIVIAAAAVFSTGCAAMFATGSDIARSVELGMSIDDFMRLTRSKPNVSVELDSLSPEGTVYRIDQWAGEDGHRYIALTRLYYFDKKGRLTEVSTRDFSRPFSDMR